MATLHAPRLVSDGLVFHYNAQNPKSHTGPALRNHIQTISPNVTSGTGYVLTGGTETVEIPTLGRTTTSFTNYQNTGASWCCVNYMNYGDTGNILTGSTLYTYLILYRTDSGYTHPNWMYRYENTSAGTYVTEAGIHDTSKRTYLGNGWYYAWNTFTTQPTTARATCYSFTYNYSSFSEKLSVAKVAILQGDYSGLHPKYWPDVNTTKANTQVLRDLANNNTITADSLTYSSDGNFSFNGSSNYMSTSMSSFNLYCLDVWLYNNNAVPNNDTTIGGPSTYQTLIQFNAGYPGGINLGAWTSGMTNEAVQIWNANSSQATYNRNAVPVGWHNFVFNWNGSTYDIWIDGVKTTTYAASAGHATLQSITSLQIGYSSPGYYFNGRIPVVKCYNTQLSDVQVLQNFNATRGLFGV